MRITGGIASGIRLNAPAGGDVRPTADRVKESLFATLGPLEGKRVVDLFAGAGSLGLEAISRGAASTVFIERDRRNEKALRANLQRVLHCLENAGISPRTRVQIADAYSFAKARHPDRALCPDIILADPPYADCLDDSRVPAWLRSSQFAAWAEETILVLEHPAKASLPWHPDGPWHIKRQKRYGETAVTFAGTAAPRS